MYEVRETAVRVVLDMYEQHRAPVLDYLPPEGCAARRNVLYKTLFEGFARVEGRPTDAEVRVSQRPDPDLGPRPTHGLTREWTGSSRSNVSYAASLGSDPGAFPFAW